MTKAQIKSTGKIVEVTSRFMPKKRNVPSREWSDSDKLQFKMEMENKCYEYIHDLME